MWHGEQAANSGCWEQQQKNDDGFNIISSEKSGKTVFYISKELIRIDGMLSKKKAALIYSHFMKIVTSIFII